MRRYNTLKWALSTLGVVLLIFVVMFGVVFRCLCNLDISGKLMFELAFKFVASLVMVVILFSGIRNSLKHQHPAAYKASIAKRIIGWVLVIIAVALFSIGLYSIFMGINAEMEMAKHYEPQPQHYYYDSNSIDYRLEPWLKLLSGIHIILPGLLLAWGYYLVKSGPLYSAKWKRWIKAVLYILVTLVLVGNVATDSMVSWISVAIVFVLMMIIVALKTDYVEPPVQQITEDINL